MAGKSEQTTNRGRRRQQPCLEEMLHDPRNVMSREAWKWMVMDERIVKVRIQIGGWQNGRVVGQDHVQIMVQRSQHVRSKEVPERGWDVS